MCLLLCTVLMPKFRENLIVTKYKNGYVMIRCMTESDAENIFSIMKQNMQRYYDARGDNWNEANIQRFFLGMNNALVEHEGKICAFTFYESTPEGAHIHTLQVVPEHQNRIFGAKLFRWYLSLAEKNGYSELTCSVFDSNPALLMYLKVGFEEVQRDNGIVRLSLSLSKGCYSFRHMASSRKVE